MLSVFICMPYGDHRSAEQRLFNAEKAMDAWCTLARTGEISPYCPHLSHFLAERDRSNWEQQGGIKSFGLIHREDWLAFSQYWLAKCDCILVLTHSGFGITEGMELEIKYANELRIPVFETYGGIGQAYGIEGL